jgi:hypothetical protein
MKRFLVFVIICIVTLSLGLTTYYFLRDNETIVVLDSYFEVNVGDTFDIDVEHINPNPNTVAEFKSLHPNIVSYNPVNNQYMAVSGGRAVITVDYNRSDFKTVAIEVVVGDGTDKAPFFVKSVEDILFIGKEEIIIGESTSITNLKKYDSSYKLQTDLDFAQLTNLDPVKMQNNGINASVYEQGVWVPIGNDALESEGFSGTFDFNGHTIYNMSIIEDNFTAGLTIENAGLFAKLEEGGVVKNLNLQDVIIQGSFENAASVAGLNFGTIETTRILSGNIDNLRVDSNTGGVAGKQEFGDELTSRVDRTYSNLTINGGEVSGGLVGHNHGGIIINSYSESQLIGSSSAKIGGIVGLNQNKEIGAANKDGVVKDTYYYGSITSESIQKGAIIGENINKDDEIRINIIRGNYYSTEISGELTGIGGVLDAELDENIGIFNKTLAQLKAENTYYSYTDRQNSDIYWAFNKTWTLNEAVNDGLPVLNMSYPRLEDGLRNISDGVSIYTVTELRNMSMSGNYVLMSDLDLSYDHDWIPIGYNSDADIEQFTGTLTAGVDLEGKYFTISNLTITSNRSVNGLFAHIGASAELYGITIENVNIDNGKNVGAIAGINDGIIQNATVTTSELLPDYSINANNSSGEANVGGIAGVSNGTIIKSSTAIVVNIEGSAGNIANAGGIVGSNYGSILDSHSTGDIFGTGLESQFLGGIAGINNYLIANSYFLGNITAPTSSEKIIAGGLTANNSFNAEIQKSFVGSGATYQAYAVGGLVGVNSGIVNESYSDVVNIKAKYSGGLAFNIKLGMFENCYTLAYLQGIDSKSVKGGFAYYIEYQNSSSYGQVVNSFSAATFDTIGANYGETSALIRTEGILAKRQAGYVVNSIYQDTNGDLREQNYLIDFINTEWLVPKEERKIVVTEEEAKNSFEIFTNAGFSTSIWQFEEWQYPTLQNVAVEQVEPEEIE